MVETDLCGNRSVFTITDLFHPPHIVCTIADLVKAETDL
jgi:hypothetical protein